MTTSITEIAKATKKGVLHSDYKIIYKGNTVFAVRVYNESCAPTGEFNMQNTDGGEPCETYSTLRELKEGFIYLVDNNLLNQ
jgi:hypothetical protein